MVWPRVLLSLMAAPFFQFFLDDLTLLLFGKPVLSDQPDRSQIA